MGSIAKYLAYGMGSVTLLAGSFFLFAALSGTPMSEMLGVGGLFPEAPEDAVAAPQDMATPVEELAADSRPVGEVIDHARSPLHAFVLPSPFSASELELLEQRLQNRIRELALRERQLEAREAELDEDRRHYDELFAELEELRNMVLDMDEEQRARTEELDRDAGVFAEKEEASLRGLAKIYADGKAKDMAQMLSDVWKPEQAAIILATLSDDRAGELLGEIYKLDPERGASFQDAYRHAERQ